MIIGIDIGSTTTKAVSLEDGKVVKKISTRAEDAITSASGAFGKIILENGIRMGDIKRILITGAGATKIEGELFGIPTEKVNEITASCRVVAVQAWRRAYLAQRHEVVELHHLAYVVAHVNGAQVKGFAAVLPLHLPYYLVLLGVDEEVAKALSAQAQL